MNRCARYVITCLWIMCLAIMAGSAAVKADGAATLERDGRSYAVPLPRGYCDITTTPLGVLLHKFLADVTAANNLAPRVDIIFQNCAAEAIFPWGYVATNNLGGVINSQQVLNRMRADLFGRAISSTPPRSGRKTEIERRGMAGASFFRRTSVRSAAPPR